MSAQTKNPSKGEQVNIVDLFFFLLSHWYWFLLCAGLALGFAWYRYAKSPLLYRGDVTVIIKDPSNSTRTVRMDTYSNMINTVSMSNEMLQLRSKSMMSDVVRSLDADVNYQVHDKLRDIELYRNSPVRVFFSREEGEDPGTFTRASPGVPMIAEADSILSCSACAFVVWKAWAMSFVTWSPPTPMTPVVARCPSE